MVVCLPSPEKLCRAIRWGCSGRARSRSQQRGADRDDLAVGLERHRRCLVRCARRSRSSACRRRRSWGRASRWGCSGRGRTPLYGVADVAVPTATILPSTGSPPRLPLGAAPEVGRLLAVAGEARVERAVGVVAGEREARPAPLSVLKPPTTILRRPGAPRRSPPSLARRSRSSLAVAGEARVERAVRVVAGHAGSCCRRGADLPTATILPSGWRTAPPQRSVRSRSRSSACRRRRRSGRGRLGPLAPPPRRRRRPRWRRRGRRRFFEGPSRPHRPRPASRPTGRLPCPMLAPLPYLPGPADRTTRAVDGRMSTLDQGGRAARPERKRGGSERS